MEQALRKAVTVVGRAHLVAELLESLALSGRDLGVNGVEKRQGRQQVLTRRALTARVLTTGSTRAAGGVVDGSACSRPSSSPIMANFAAPSGSRAPSTNRVTRTALPSKSDTASPAAKRSAG